MSADKAREILGDVEKYYSEKMEHYGSVAQGVDWNSVESQLLRFDQLLKILDSTSGFSINDLGCGYGSLVDKLETSYRKFRYVGADISQKMIAAAREKYQRSYTCFFNDVGELSPEDYTVSSGVFNVRLHHSIAEWEDYVRETLQTMNALSLKGFAFNLLTKYSDSDRMRSDLYYADPCKYFDFCKRHFSKNVALLHDYGLYEFTILVRK